MGHADGFDVERAADCGDGAQQTIDENDSTQRRNIKRAKCGVA